MSLLRIRGFGHRYGARRALAPMDLTLERGESLAVLGPSGCGKSTLLQATAGLLEIGEGTIERGWQNLGMVFQEPRLLAWRSALDNIALGLKARGVRRRERRAAATALGTRLGLSAADLALYPAALSGGMRSRVALARALAIEPDLLLLDEPFAALDIGLRHELEQWLLRECLRLGCTMLMITHSPREALRLADRLLVLGGQPGRPLLALQPALRATDRSERDVLALETALLADTGFRAAFGLPPDERVEATDRAPETAWFQHHCLATPAPDRQAC
ncbi:NitT/TauT family transport system ATP-binding protein [Tahibacter aquaticus]|uniref:NitT/TauT family transport system ATP-binding protein n=1 Tax=Tahibacter aquaticus TaxID=520092 RepID=A0A4R6YMI1_9GAMM|nr:ABC transporter ATP-binding protein [Tahibacter aquaticus]TDR38566.1 NitT/TauT family transport system ATP-binding protein [Tahibacter aquaticus]